MTSPLRIALIGAGAMGRQHAGYIANEPDAQLVAIADPFSDTLAKELGVHHFHDHLDMLELARPEAVIIANPNDLHVDTTLECMKRGIPALLEKPIASSRDGAERLLNAQRQYDTPVLVGHHRRHNPVTMRTKEVIDSGQLGRLATITAMWQTCKPTEYFEADWRRQRGAGVVLINLVHDLDLMRHLCGEISALQASTNNALRGYEVEDSAAILLEFENGALGMLVGSDAVVSPWGWDQNVNEVPLYAKHLDQGCYYLAGTQAALTVPQMRLWQYAGPHHWGHNLNEQTLAVADGSAQQNQLYHFIQVARGETLPLISIQDAMRTMIVIDAIEEAAASGRRITLRYP